MTINDIGLTQLFASKNIIAICRLPAKHDKTFLLQKFVDRGAGTTKVDGFRMVQTMAASIEAMMQHKIDAIKVSF